MTRSMDSEKHALEYGRVSVRKQRLRKGLTIAGAMLVIGVAIYAVWTYVVPQVRVRLALRDLHGRMEAVDAKIVELSGSASRTGTVDVKSLAPELTALARAAADLTAAQRGIQSYPGVQTAPGVSGPINPFGFAVNFAFVAKSTIDAGVLTDEKGTRWC